MSPQSDHAQKRLDAVSAQFRAAAPWFLSARDERDRTRAKAADEKRALLRLVSDAETNQSAAQVEIEALRAAKDQAAANTIGNLLSN